RSSDLTDGRLAGSGPLRPADILRGGPCVSMNGPARAARRRRSSTGGSGVHEEARTARSRRRTIVSALIGVALTMSVILYPEDAFEASVGGLRLWFEVVLLALLPFFVRSEMMIGLVVMHFIGVLLEP